MRAGSVYVAGRTKDIENVRLAQRICEEAGFEITFDWTGTDGEIRSDWAEAAKRARVLAQTERDAVRNADLLVLVWKATDSGGPVGALLETGMAMALGKRVIIVGPARESVFWYLPEVERVEDLEGLREAL